MCEVIVSENNKIDLTNMVLENISIRDPQYAIQFFADSLRSKLVQVDTFAEKICNTIIKDTPIATQAAKALEKGSRFVVDISDSTKRAIHSGQLKLVTENGRMRAQLLDGNGRYSTKLDIKEEFFGQGFDAVQMANALQLKTIQEQLEQITDQIVMINSSVIDVLQGQQNDRIALFYSGMNLYLESETIKNPEMKSALMTQAMRALSDGTQQLILTMESDIDFLKTKKYDKLRSGKKEAVQDRMDSINKAFGFIHQATLARAAIYCKQDEYIAMAQVLDEYSSFIDETIASNANLLSQCDKSDDGTMFGLWQSRAKLKLDVSELKKSLLSKGNEYYLLIGDENNEN